MKSEILDKKCFLISQKSKFDNFSTRNLFLLQCVKLKNIKISKLPKIMNRNSEKKATIAHAIFHTL